MSIKVIRLKTAMILTVAVAAIFGGLGAAGGMEYALRGMDAIDNAAAADRAAYDSREEAARRANVASLTAELRTCREYFSASTLIYDSAPRLDLSITGVPGLPVIPVGMQTNANARWFIPARIKPQTYGESRGAVYFYARRDPGYSDGRLLTEGPFVPESVQSVQADNFPQRLASH